MPFYFADGTEVNALPRRSARLAFKAACKDIDESMKKGGKLHGWLRNAQEAWGAYKLAAQHNEGMEYQERTERFAEAVFEHSFAQYRQAITDLRNKWGHIDGAAAYINKMTNYRP
jgi:hypothetical protein